MSRERNVAGAFPLDQPKERWGGVDYNKCVICQDTPEKGLMTLKSSLYQNSMKLFVVDPMYTRLKDL